MRRPISVQSTLKTSPNISAETNVARHENIENRRCMGCFLKILNTSVSAFHALQ